MIDITIFPSLPTPTLGILRRLLPMQLQDIVLLRLHDSAVVQDEEPLEGAFQVPRSSVMLHVRKTADVDIEDVPTEFPEAASWLRDQWVPIGVTLYLSSSAGRAKGEVKDLLLPLAIALAEATNGRIDLDDSNLGAAAGLYEAADLRQALAASSFFHPVQ